MKSVLRQMDVVSSTTSRLSRDEVRLEERLLEGDPNSLNLYVSVEFKCFEIRFQSEAIVRRLHILWEDLAAFRYVYT